MPLTLHHKQLRACRHIWVCHSQSINNSHDSRCAAGSADDAPAYSTPTVRASIADPLHQVSLPSTETSGAVAKESIGGTGALPGHVSEAAVTQLPDDRNSDSGPGMWSNVINRYNH